MPALDREVVVHDPEDARRMFADLYNVQRLDVGGESPTPFEWHWKLSPRGPATLVQGHANSRSAVLVGAPSQVVILMVLDGHLQVKSAGQCIDVFSGQTAAIVNATELADARIEAGTRTLNFCINPNALVSYATAIVGAPVSSKISFEPCIDLSRGPGTEFLRLMQIFEQGCRSCDSPLGSPHVVSHLREALLGTLLLGQGSSIREILHKPVLTGNARVVQRAEDLLAARANEEISLAEIAKELGIGLRSLERTFKVTRGYSPREFLKQRRMDLAHRCLRAAAPGTTVTEVLYGSGFSHPGEFSRAYRQQFGEAPSETLRRARGECVGNTTAPFRE